MLEKFRTGTPTCYASFSMGKKNRTCHDKIPKKHTVVANPKLQSASRFFFFYINLRVDCSKAISHLMTRL